MSEHEVVVVGFRHNQRASIGYRSFNSPGDASVYVAELLLKGADVISVRRLWD